MTTEADLTELVRDFFADAGEFRAGALFDPPLDCIRVMARDCSATETRVNDFLTVIEDNNPPANGSKYVGFTIKGAKHLCKTWNLPLNAPVRIADLLDAVVSLSSEPFVRIIVETVAVPVAKEGEIEHVDFAETSTNLAPAPQGM